MLEFNCTHCGASIAVTDDQRSRAVTCMSCNTRMRVPEDARQIPNAAALAQAAVHERVALPPRPPKYDLVGFAGGVIIVTGIIECIIALIATLTMGSLVPLLWFVGGIVTMGFGALMFCIRDIAIHTWHIRHQK
jgi:DNA-directed RNA polymerase subunit RPC12/RpoP